MEASCSVWRDNVKTFTLTLLNVGQLVVRRLTETARRLSVLTEDVLRLFDDY